jgi:hypothetical protein
MKRIVTAIFLFVLLILCSFNFYIVFKSGSSINWNGVTVAKISAAVVIIALFFLIYRKIEVVLLNKGLIQERIKTVYDYVPIILYLLFATGGQYFGDPLKVDRSPGLNRYEFDWHFSWGLVNENSYVVIILALVILLLYRCYKLIEAIERQDSK